MDATCAVFAVDVACAGADCFDVDESVGAGVFGAGNTKSIPDAYFTSGWDVVVVAAYGAAVDPVDAAFGVVWVDPFAVVFFAFVYPAYLYSTLDVFFGYGRSVSPPIRRCVLRLVWRR